MKDLLQYACDTYSDRDCYDDLFDAIVSETLTNNGDIDNWVQTNG
jgi:hypothetical protein